MATNPFDILPPNLFNVFSTQGHGGLQRHYMAIFLRIYDLAEFNRFGLTREVVVAEMVDYLKAVDPDRPARLRQPARSGATSGGQRAVPAVGTGRSREAGLAA